MYTIDRIRDMDRLAQQAELLPCIQLNPGGYVAPSRLPVAKHTRPAAFPRPGLEQL